MITYATDENFQDLISEGIVLVDFFGPNCGPCRMLAMTLEDLNDELPFVNIVKVNVAECPQAAAKYGVQGIPDVYIMKDCEPVEHFLGTKDKDWLSEKLAGLIYG